MIEIEPEAQPVHEGTGGWLLSSLRAARSSRHHVELAAARGDLFARCALSFLPPSLFVIHFCAEWNGYDSLVRVALDELAYLPAWSLRRIDIDREPDVAAEIGVLNVPTLIAFDRGRELGRLVGSEGVEAWLLVHRAELLERSATDQRAG